MYRLNLSREDLKRLRGGDKDTLIRLLEEQDLKIVEDLKKTSTANLAFLQGISFLADSLLTKLKV